MWTSEVHRDHRVLADLSGWWNSQPSVQATPFLHTQLLSVSGLSGGSREQFRLHLLYRRGEVVAGLPLHRDRWRYRTPARTYASPFNLVLSPAPEVVDYLPRWLARLPMAQLYRLPADSPLLRVAANHPRWGVQNHLPSPYVDLTGREPPVPVSRNLRKSLRRRRRRLEELGTVTYVDHPEPDDVADVLKRGLALEARGWKGREGVAVLNSPRYERWLKGVVEVAESHRWLRLSGLYLDDEIIAFSLDLEYHQRRFSVLSAYSEDPRVTPLSPGSLLLEEVLTHAHRAGLESYEFGYGGQPWKYEWTDRERGLADLVVFGSGWFGGILHRAYRLRRARGAPQGTVMV